MMNLIFALWLIAFVMVVSEIFLKKFMTKRTETEIKEKEGKINNER